MQVHAQNESSLASQIARFARATLKRQIVYRCREKLAKSLILVFDLLLHPRWWDKRRNIRRNQYCLNTLSRTLSETERSLLFSNNEFLGRKCAAQFFFKRSIDFARHAYRCRVMIFVVSYKFVKGDCRFYAARESRSRITITAGGVVFREDIYESFCVRIRRLYGVSPY